MTVVEKGVQEVTICLLSCHFSFVRVDDILYIRRMKDSIHRSKEFAP
jgi:hypothetical protein